MYQINFNQPIRIHFIGIGGISMSGLAEILLTEGFSVSGSDAVASELTKHLEELGAVIYLGHHQDHITPDIEAVVFTAAVHEDNPEYMETMRKGIPLLSRAELLGQLMHNYPLSIAVSGTHGKTTTTSMLSGILMQAKLNPTISLGGMLKSIGGNTHIGDSEYFITEACEYTNSFLTLYPYVSIILNIRPDHMDFFKDLEDIRHSFHEYALQTSDKGTLVINSAVTQLDSFIADLPCQVVTFGSDQTSDYCAKDIQVNENFQTVYTLYKKGASQGEVRLNVLGEHNVLNSLAAIAAAEAVEIPMSEIKKGLLSYTGVDRRFEKKGEISGVTIVDDYAHHPDEIMASLSAARALGARRIWCVFQPHTYSRTKAFLTQFAQALSLADEIVLAEIYPARESDTLGISSQNLADCLRKLGKEPHYFSSFDDIEIFLLENCIKGDLLITMGAGDIVKIGNRLLGL